MKETKIKRPYTQLPNNTGKKKLKRPAIFLISESFT